MLNVHDEYHIPTFLQHALMKLVHGVPFDFEDCFIRILVSCADDHTSLMSYAPCLMALCNFSRPKPFPSTVYPLIYTPPVRDVLQVTARHNDPFAEYTGVRAHVTERNIRTRLIKRVHHMEVSLRTQQMFQHFNEEDRVQKQEIMNELNLLCNIVVNNGNIGREGLHRH